MLGATCSIYVLYISNVMWTALGQDTGICVVNCDYTKIMDICLVLNTLLNWQSPKCTVSLQMLVSVNLH